VQVKQRRPALTHVILVAGGELIRQHTATNTIVPVVVTTDGSGHTRDWGTLGLMVILYIFATGCILSY
jgi:hypothetical protein